MPTVAPAVSVAFVIFEYAPPPPPAEKFTSLGVTPPPPPPITSMVLSDEFQSEGTDHVVPEVRKTVVAWA
jgi:hypothetical protein